MVFGTPTTGIPFCENLSAMARLPSPPTATRTSNPSRRKFSTTTLDSSRNSPGAPGTGRRNGSPRLVVPRMVPPCGTIPATRSGVSGNILEVSRRPP